MAKDHDYMCGPPEGECEQIMMMSMMGPHVFCCRPATKDAHGRWWCQEHQTIVEVEVGPSGISERALEAETHESINAQIDK